MYSFIMDGYQMQFREGKVLGRLEVCNTISLCVITYQILAYLCLSKFLVK